MMLKKSPEVYFTMTPLAIALLNKILGNGEGNYIQYGVALPISDLSPQWFTSVL